MRIQIARKEEHSVGNYKVILVYDIEGKVVGAFIYSPRGLKPIYIAIHEEVRMKLPRHVKTFLSKHGFKVAK